MTTIQRVARIVDLLLDILKRLPLKTLFQFNLVCKQWHTLITDPVFRNLLISNQNSIALGFFCEVRHGLSRLSRPLLYLETPPLVYVPFSAANRFPPKLKFNGFEHSCNGLILCSARSFGQVFYYVYNPTTGEFLRLPKPTGRPYILPVSEDNVTPMYLAFDPDKSPNYKVVAFKTPAINVYEIYIYSSNTRLWELCEEMLHGEDMISGGVYWNGGIHWINPRPPGFAVYFSIENQMLKTMPTPPMNLEHHTLENTYYFGESCGHLHYAWNQYKEFKVYEMKSNYSRWFIKHRVDLSQVFHAYPRIRRNAVWISSVVSGKEEDDGCFLVVMVPGKAIRYNLVSKTFTELHDFGSSTCEIGIAFQYIESLCSV